MSESKCYPSWRYHKSHEPFLVQNEEEDQKLGKGWADSPAAFQAEGEEPEGKQEKSREEQIAELADNVEAKTEKKKK